MKCIILASGKGTRLRPLTNTVPKPLIKIAGRPIIEHNIEHIYEHVNEIILVVRHLGEQFPEYFGKNYKGTPIRYVKQSEEKGTAAALKGITDIKEDVIVLYGDSIFEKGDLEKILHLDGYGCLVQHTDTPEKYGIFVEQVDGSAMKVVEKPTEDYGNLANVGVYKFTSLIVSLVENVQLSERGEYELTDAINLFCAGNTFKLIQMDGNFIDIGYPWQILEANAHFLGQLTESKISGIVEDNVTIKGNIILEEGAILKSGTYIEGNCIIGKNSSIGPNTYLRGVTVIGEGSKIGNAVEIKNSSIGNKTNVAHLSYIGDSVIGNNVNVGGGLITANVRHDKKNMRCMIEGKLVDTGMRKLGLIIGDNAKLGIKNAGYPARIIDTNGATLPGEIIK